MIVQPLAYRIAELASLSPDWFPQQHAHGFYVAKGLISLVAVLLYVTHTVQTWGTLRDWAQRARYLVLFYFSALLTFSSVEQVHDDSLVNYRNIGGMVGAVLLILVALLSIYSDRRRSR